MNGLRFIFVHGLSGWGGYDKAYRRMPYWGMRGGDLMAFLREKGARNIPSGLLRCQQMSDMMIHIRKAQN